MANVIPQRKAQVAEAEHLGKDARLVGMRCVASSTLFLAQSLLKSIDGFNQSMHEGERAMALVRSDPEFQTALDNDIIASTSAVHELLVEAMGSALSSEMMHLQKQMRGLVFKFTDEDEMIINSFPIHGHDARELASYMHDGLRHEVIGVMSEPLSGVSNDKTVPQQLGLVVQRFADKTEAAVVEAYFAGLQLAMRMIAQAINNAR